MERLRDRGDVPRLVDLLSKEDWLGSGESAVDLEVGRRVEAVTALGALRTPEAEAGVARALQDRDARVLRAAVGALRPAPGLAAAKALARAAATWRTPGLAAPRADAIDLLVELADELYAVQYAEALLDDVPTRGLAAEEASAVRRLFAADHGPVAELFADQLVQRLAAEDECERRLVADMLVAIGAGSVNVLIPALADPQRRRAAARVLGAVRDSRAIPALTDLLSSADAPSRAAAARALGEIRDPAAIEPLVRVSSDPEPDVRDAALDGLDRMRGLLLAVIGAASVSAGRHPERFEVDHRALLHRILARQPPPRSAG